MNEKKVKYFITIVVTMLIIGSVIFLAHLENKRLEYNRIAEEFKIANTKMFESLCNAWDDSDNSLKRLIGDYVIFYQKFSEFDSCLRELHRMGIYPQIHLEYGIERSVLTSTFFEFRDLYYECVDTLYLEKTTPKEEWVKRLQDIDETFKIMTIEIEFWEYYKAL